MKTGLTADCTILEMNEDTDLSQIRPAFGGNIMAHIKTPYHRPQMATVRYKIMNAPKRSVEETGEIVNCTIAKERLDSHVDVRMAAGEMSDRFKRAYSQTEAYYYLWGLRSSSVYCGYEPFGNDICNQQR